MNKILFFLFSGVWAATIIINSLKAPEILGNYENITGPFAWLFDFLNIDGKNRGLFLSIGGHIFEFFFLAIFLLGFIRSFNLRYPQFLACAAATFLGLIDEFIQGFVPGRVSSVGDVFLDIIGAGLGILAVFLTERILKPNAFLGNRYMRSSFLQKL